jgi:predicted secreted protein
VGEGELRLLGREQKEIRSTLPYSLYRKDLPPRVVVSDADSGREVELAVGQELVVRLTGSRATGLSWARPKAEDGVLEPSGEPEYVPNTGMGVVGAAGVEIFRFKAARAGRQRLAFDYRRPLLRDQPPAKTVSFEVSVR